MQTVVFGILYMLVGILLAIPYCLLAGWSPQNFPSVAVVAPAFVFIWFMLASIAGILSYGPRGTTYFNWRAAFGKSERPLTIFWMWTLYSFLPIMLHWSAVLLGKIGYETVSSLIDTHRYSSSFYALMATLILFILITMVIGVWTTVMSVWTRIAHR